MYALAYDNDCHASARTCWPQKKKVPAKGAKGFVIGSIETAKLEKECSAGNPKTCRLCHRTVYALDLTKGGDVPRIKEKVGLWLSNPLGRSDQVGGRKDNPMSNPTHLREKL